MQQGDIHTIARAVRGALLAAGFPGQQAIACMSIRCMHCKAVHVKASSQSVQASWGASVHRVENTLPRRCSCCDRPQSLPHTMSWPTDRLPCCSCTALLFIDGHCHTNLACCGLLAPPLPPALQVQVRGAHLPLCRHCGHRPPSLRGSDAQQT